MDKWIYKIKKTSYSWYNVDLWQRRGGRCIRSRAGPASTQFRRGSLVSTSREMRRADIDKPALV